ncbi:hypothetical protein FB451DRAFT_1413648 [Mycena latifolia]|nr:hypothetical protein FB451DRAFT_1413648 [Mycena latifolia]
MLMTDSSHPGAFIDEPEEMPAPISLPEPVPAIAEEPKPASDAPAPDEPQPQRAVDEPAQERAPAVDEATYFDPVPAAPMHMIAEASPRSASETVVGAEEHSAADAPVEPVAEANVREERAEVPQPRQWADEGGWDSRAVSCPRSVGASRRGPASFPSDGELPICTRDSSSAWLGMPRNAKALVRGIGGTQIARTVSDSSCGRDSERSEGSTRVRESASAQFPGTTFILSIAVGTNTRLGLFEFAPAGGAASIPRRERGRGG